MKIAVCGTQCIGKTTFIQDFVQNWPQYSIGESAYGKLLASGKIVNNKEGNEPSQKAILDALCDQIMYCKDENVIFDRCVLDNLVYTLWLSANGRVSDTFVQATIDIVKQTLVFFDLILFLPITSTSPVQVIARSGRETDPQYRVEIDNIFKSLHRAHQAGSTVYFPFNEVKGCPGIVEIYGTREERIELTKMYITPEGQIPGEGQSLLDDIDAVALAAETMARPKQ